MRRTLGTGTVERRESGRWRYKLTLPDGSRRSSPPYDTREEADRQLAVALHLVSQGAALPATTLGAYGETWLGLRRSANVATERGLWKHHVLPCELAELALQDVRPKALLAWAAGLRRHRRLVQQVGGPRVAGAPISPQTQRLCWAVVRRVLASAVEEELLTVNPARGLRPDWPDGDEVEALSFLDEADIVRLLGCEAIPLPARLHYGWAIGAGPRQRESWALRWRQVDLEELQAEITRSGRRTTKAKKARRFPLLPLAAESLRRWREICPDPSPDALVWPARLLPPLPGEPRWRSPGTMRRDGKKGDDMGWADRSRGKQGVTVGHRALAGIREGVTYHDLRHTCAAGLLRGYVVLGAARRWSLEEVCDFLGHSDRRTTERYAHIAGGGLAARAAAEGRIEQDAAVQEGGSEVPSASRPSALLLDSPVGDRGAVRTRDLLFRKHVCPVRSPAVTPPTGRGRDGDAPALARALLRDVAAGREVHPEHLARAVLAERMPQLAQQVLAEGDHAIMRALELAVLVLEAERQEVPRAGSGSKTSAQG